MVRCWLELIIMSRFYYFDVAFCFWISPYSNCFHFASSVYWILASVPLGNYTPIKIFNTNFELGVTRTHSSPPNQSTAFKYQTTSATPPPPPPRTHSSSKGKNILNHSQHLQRYLKLIKKTKSANIESEKDVEHLWVMSICLRK